jgi:hypothetical protein
MRVPVPPKSLRRRSAPLMWPLGHGNRVDPPLLAGWLCFSVLRIQIWWAGAQVVAWASSSIKSPQLQPYVDSDVEKLVGVVWSSMTSYGCGDLWIIKELHRRFIFFLHLRDGCGLLGLLDDFPSAINNVRPALGGAAAVKVEDEGNLKAFDVIFIFVEVFCTIRCFF